MPRALIEDIVCVEGEDVGPVSYTQAEARDLMMTLDLMRRSSRSDWLALSPRAFSVFKQVSGRSTGEMLKAHITFDHRLSGLQVSCDMT